MLRLVVDTDVMFAALCSPTGASRALVAAILEGRASLLLSTALLLEYEAVLTRSHVLKRAGISMEDVLAVLDALAERGIAVGFDFRWRPQAADPDDDLVLETAVNGGANAIASFNLADLAAAGRRFGIAVERPATLLRRIAT